MLARRLSRWLSAGAAGLLTAAMAVVVAAPDARSAVADDEACRPDGLYRTPGVSVPYCTVYDTAGREKMGADHTRRIIGYFTSWRTGRNGAPAYLVNQIPWQKVTHINYAFAHVDGTNKISPRQPGRREQPGHEHDLARRGRRRDGPGPALHRTLQPAQQVQEAAPGRPHADQRRRLGRDRRLHRRQRQPA